LCPVNFELPIVELFQGVDEIPRSVEGARGICVSIPCSIFRVSLLKNIVGEDLDCHLSLFRGERWEGIFLFF